MSERRDPNQWRPLAGMPEGAEAWGSADYAALTLEWREIRAQLAQDEAARLFVHAWESETLRRFALETGQIEGLYTMRLGEDVDLVVEGFDSASAEQVVEPMTNRELQDLLGDQLAALQMAKADAESGQVLWPPRILAWHERTTRHQTGTPVFRPDGGHYEKPFVSKGRWKTEDNFIRRPDGTLLEFCPVDRVQSEMDRFATLYHEIRQRNLPVEAEAAWAHHRFVRTHPFDDGNGRVSRLLMAYAYFRRGLPPPTIRNRDKADYYFMLDRAAEGDLRRFSRYMGALALPTLEVAVALGEQALKGELSRTNGNGGRTVGDRYYPPGGRGRGHGRD